MECLVENGCDDSQEISNAFMIKFFHNVVKCRNVKLN